MRRALKDWYEAAVVFCGACPAETVQAAFDRHWIGEFASGTQTALTCATLPYWYVRMNTLHGG